MNTTKKCKHCNIVKDLQEFRIKTNSISRVCKICLTEQAKLWYNTNKELIKEKARLRYKNNPKVGKTKRSKHYDPVYRSNWLKRRYNIDLEIYNKMLLDQNNVCMICNQPETRGKTKYLSVDHCHTTGKVRDLLCGRCNTVLGYVKDNPDHLIKAAKYLIKHSVDKLQ